jgi:hypothetical protein
MATCYGPQSRNDASGSRESKRQFWRDVTPLEIASWVKNFSHKSRDMKAPDAVKPQLVSSQLAKTATGAGVGAD